MKILITGALGHIGSFLIRDLFKQKSLKIDKLILIDNFKTNRYSSLFKLNFDKIEFYENDVANVISKNIFNKNIDCVIHLAAITDAANSFNIKNEIFKNNFGCTKNITKLCLKYNLPLIFVSSTSIYGKNNSIVDEDTPSKFLKPQSPYAECKLKEEKYLINISKKNKFKYVILRFGTICGTSKGMRFHTAVNKFCFQAIFNQSLTIWKTALKQKRPYLTLSDASNAISFIIKNKIYDGKIYNIVSQNLVLEQIIKYIRKYFPKLKIKYVESKIMNQLSYDVSTKKIENKGFKFSGNIKQSIKKTIKIFNNKL